MLRKKSWLLWLVMLLAASLFLSGGCGGGGDGGDPIGPPDDPIGPPDDPDGQEFIEIPEEQVLLENEVFNPEIRSVPGEDILSSSYDDPDNDKPRGAAPLQVVVSSADGGYEIGDVMAAQPSSDAKYGFTGVVEGVTDNPDGTQTVTLRQALLSDVLVDGDIFFSFGKTPDEFAASYGGGYSAAPGYAGQSLSGGAYGWDDLWDLVTRGITLTGELKGNILSERFSFANNATLKARFFEFIGFEATASLDSSFKMDVDAFISIRNNHLEKVALGFPIQVTSGAGVSFKTKLSKKDEFAITPPLTVPSAPILVGPCVIPTYFVTEGLLVLETGVDGRIGFSCEGVCSGGIGFWWESGSGFHEMDFQKKWSFTGGPETGDLFDEAFFEFGIGPKFSFALGIPKAKVFSASPTIGTEIKFDTDGYASLDAKFKAKFSADLLTAMLGLLPSSVAKTDASFTLEAKYNIYSGNGATDPPPVTNGSWSDAADTDWYYADPGAANFAIGSEAELAGLAYLVNNGIDNFSGQTVTLTRALDLGGKAWTPISPIGIGNSTFGGTFDGGGHTISNMTVVMESSFYAGLFGYNTGTIKDVDLSAAYVSSSYHHACAGGIAGRNHGTIEDCASRASEVMAANASGGPAYAGGFIGCQARGNNVSLSDNRNYSITPAIGWDERKSPAGSSEDI